MSDPKRGALITVGAPKSAKNKVTKTVRLTINLDESNESKYPELNYKELVIAEEKKKKVVNGKTPGLDPFSDNDDDIERVARKFEQKYGSKSSYGKKGKDEFADIGAGYDENDSFIDNTDGYDEMIPPECDTIYGGFYINCGSLEFKAAERSPSSDVENAGTRNKRRISSSSSEEESSESSSESESPDEKETKLTNDAAQGDETEHRKKKNKNIDKKKAKKIRSTDSSAATSGKQTSDEQAGEEAESADSGADSLASRRRSSAATSDSSRDVESNEVKLPQPITLLLEELQANAKRLADSNGKGVSLSDPSNEQIMVRLHGLTRALPAAGARAAWERAARALGSTRAKLLRALAAAKPPPAQQSVQPNQATAATKTINNKRKVEEEKEIDYSSLTAEEREAMLVETLERLKALIEERKPSMLANYQAECERVQEERKKIQIACASEGAPHIEKRLPKRRFPWCPLARRLVQRARQLAGSPPAAAGLLARRVLPLFPAGFVRMPALLRQADLSKEIKENAAKRPRLNSQTQPQAQLQPTFTEPIHFPSSLTVTASVKPPPEKTETIEKKSTSVFGSIINSFSMSKDLIIEKPEKKRDDIPKEDLYIPPNNIGSITITAVTNKPKEEKKTNNVTDKKEGLIRIKTPAVLNNMVRKELDKIKKPEKIVKDKRLEMPLQIDTNYQMNKKLPSPNLKKLPSPVVKDEISKKQIENMRVIENNIPRPALVPVHHSPTFAKPDKRPPEVKKKKDLVIVSDVDPLSDNQEPVNVDDSSSDVEVVEDKSESKSEVPSNNVREPSDKNSAMSVKDCVNNKLSDAQKTEEEATNDDFEMVMRNIKEMSNSQDTSKLSNSYEGVIKSAKRISKQPYGAREMYQEGDDNKFTERTSLNKMDGCSPVTG